MSRFFGFVFAACLLAIWTSTTVPVPAQEPVKIGFILPMTGQLQSTGKQESAAIKLYMVQHGDLVAG